jgi:peptidyl-prolyl cis-trans isomerase A (cyclophilin A)
MKYFILLTLFLSSTLYAQSYPTEVIIKTTFGNVVVELDQKTPITSNNFYKYVTAGFYNGMSFHRIMPGFVIQAGAFIIYPKGTAPEMTYFSDIFPTIKNEAQFAKSNLRGTISMARTRDPDSASSQFFINLVDNQSLDFDEANNKAGFAVFGTIKSGMENVIDQIAQIPTSDRTFTYTDGKDYTFQNVPVVPALILEMTIK